MTQTTNLNVWPRQLIAEKTLKNQYWTLERVTRPNGTGFYQLTEFVGREVCKNRGYWERTDCPVIHGFTIAYDRPESLPDHIKNWTQRKLLA